MNVNLNESLSNNLFLLQTCGIWPVSKHKFLYRLYQIALIVLLFTYNATQIIYLIQNRKHLTGNQTSYVTFYSLDIVVKCGIFLKKLPEIRKVIETLQSERDFQPKNPTDAKIIGTIMSICRLITPCIVFFFVTVALFYSCAFFWAEQAIIFNAWFPYEVSSTEGSYVLTFLYQMSCGTCETLADLGIDVLFSILMLHIGCQCDLICVRIEYLQNSSQLRRDFNSMVLHYNKIIR